MYRIFLHGMCVCVCVAEAGMLVRKIGEYKQKLADENNYIQGTQLSPKHAEALCYNLQTTTL